MDILDILKLKYPIIQAPMAGGATTVELICGVCNQGALGSMGAGYLSATAIGEQIQLLKQQTELPFNINLFVPNSVTINPQQLQKMQNALIPLYQQLGQTAPSELPTQFAQNFHHQVETLLREKVPVFSFTFGIPDSEILKEFKQQGTIILGTATSIEEAALLAECVDAIVLQGSEAGGHRGTFIGSEESSLTPILKLIRQVRSAKIKRPLIASGGIAEHSDIKQVIASGAIAAQIGTLFLSCDESGIAPCYKNALIQAKHDSTVLTRAFSGKLARGISNSFIKQLKQLEELKNIQPLPYPVQNALTQPLRKLAGSQNNTDYLSLWAGQSVHHCHKTSVNALLNRLTQPT
ncbi:Nitronate monooxygenase [Piscirickettsia salmonis]|uniref:NAD(P)H-dependent flavin oxidoreductase n=1 Tax=Piscirickettsia salmonis TaxID=1238 RepID=UPI0012B84C92|nr:nitronate monooxygenase [Piscirickettsia salmonis]QGP48860.1 Nitronate monooxygenase [Piscirickettsia salmonis]